MKKILFMICFFISVNSFAVIPTTDIYQQASDDTTTAAYAGQITTYLTQIGSTLNAAQQVSSLKGLSSIQGAGNQLCALCNQTDLGTLNQYATDINSDLCSQFSNSLTNITGAAQSITTLQGIMATFATNPKAAALALQQAAVATHTATQNTMAQIQMLEAQAQQRELAQEKLQQQNSQEALGSGFHSGL